MYKYSLVTQINTQ